jgi:2,4-dienoyl-CoA reductase-like NADH-dependent reductase (Old Yellow Enzyme family)/NADPH-dependent 2,4-dienoyl-CoA reductase/sulfur reductase-like enzyme
VHNKFPNLFSPIKVGTHTYKNRVIGAPIFCGPFVSLPFLSDVTLQAVEDRAKGGCAQVTVGETPVDFEYANKDPFPPIDYTNFNDPAFAKLGQLARVIKQYGAAAMIELSHCGAARLPLPQLKHPIGPVTFENEAGAKVQGMDVAMIDKVINEFVVCARFMKAAGYDGVLIHCGHGWLLNQFLSARTNTRTDEYGGSLENRARFPMRVLQSLRAAMGKDFILEVRVSGDERIEHGMGVDEVAAFCKRIEGIVDLIHVSVGIYRDPVLSGQFSSLFDPHGLNAELSAVIKKAVKIPVTVVGGINSPESADQIIAEQKCDCIALGRQLTADPAFAAKAESGNEDDIARCLRCYKCFPGPLEGVMDDLSKLFGCTVNPEAFFFDKKVLESKPTASREVVVIGGGVAGMEAAIVAADRGHKVTLYEKEKTLGGLLKFADSDEYKGDLKGFKDLMVRRVGKRGKIKVVTGKDFTPQDLAAIQADALVLAVGSTPVKPPIAGIENAVRALDVYASPAQVGKKVVMVGGGLVGSEAGLHLAKNGREVLIVEMVDKVAPDSYPMHRIALVHEMDKMLSYRTGLKVTSIAKNGVKTVDGEGKEEFLPADTVVYALGMRANRKETEALRNVAKVRNLPVYEIGDCVRAAKVYDAIREGYLAAMAIL